MYLRNTKNWNMLQSIKKARLYLFCLFVCSDCLRNKIITSYISKNLRQNIWSQRKGNEFANSPLRDELNNFWVIKYTFKRSYKENVLVAIEIIKSKDFVLCNYLCANSYSIYIKTIILCFYQISCVIRINGYMIFDTTFSCSLVAFIWQVIQKTTTF